MWSPSARTATPLPCREFMSNPRRRWLNSAMATSPNRAISSSRVNSKLCVKILRQTVKMSCNSSNQQTYKSFGKPTWVVFAWILVSLACITCIIRTGLRMRFTANRMYPISLRASLRKLSWHIRSWDISIFLSLFRSSWEVPWHFRVIRWMPILSTAPIRICTGTDSVIWVGSCRWLILGKRSNPLRTPRVKYKTWIKWKKHAAKVPRSNSRLIELTFYSITFFDLDSFPFLSFFSLLSRANDFNN